MDMTDDSRSSHPQVRLESSIVACSEVLASSRRAPVIGGMVTIHHVRLLAGRLPITCTLQLRALDHKQR